jgi:hypothetical protein
MSTVLPDDLVWDAPEGGDRPGEAHLSELALTAIADGEEALLPEVARDHVERCEACAMKLGDAAMLSSAIGDALRAVPHVPHAMPSVAPAKVESVRPKARVPRGAIAIGLALAVIGAVPMMLDLPALVSDLGFYLSHGVPVLFRGGVSLARAGVFSAAVPVLTAMSACVLVIASIVLMRRLPATAATQGVS